MRPWPAILTAACLAATAASSQPREPAVGPRTATAPGAARAGAINAAAWPTPPRDRDARRAVLIRAEVLLARARFSPGVIDGEDGENLRKAIAAFEAAHGLPQDGRLGREVWSILTQDAAPVVAEYRITAADLAGPFAAKIPTKYEDMARLPALPYTSPLEALAEKFHMDPALLKALNPGARFDRADEPILVARPGAETLPAQAARIEVDKSAREVRAFAPDGSLLAVYPATVGSAERPAPSGTFTVRGVVRNPLYTYDPKRLTFGDRRAGKLRIRPGPNNPVGVVWIDLSIPTYGIHGAPEPRLVGKTASHGCVRLTNWDASQLASAVKKGATVAFVGVEGPPARLSSASAR